jgi:hypothetical protein
MSQLYVKQAVGSAVERPLPWGEAHGEKPHVWSDVGIGTVEWEV